MTVVEEGDSDLNSRDCRWPRGSAMSSSTTDICET